MIYRRGTPTDAVQTRGPNMIYGQDRKWPHRQGAPTEQASLTDAVQFILEKGPYKQGTPTWYTGKGPLLVKGSIQARGHNISITALPDFKKIIHFFNTSLSLKNKNITSNRKFCYIYSGFNFKSYEIFTSDRMEISPHVYIYINSGAKVWKSQGG